MSFTINDDEFAALIILSVALVGLVLAVTSAYLVFRVNAFRNPFGYLCASHMIADAGVLLIFVVWCAPAVTFQWDSSSTRLGRRMGHLSLFFWFATLYAQVGIALNRFLAMGSPSLYRKVFSTQGTRNIVVVGWVLPMFHCIVYFFDGCDFTFNSQTYYWEFAQTKCGNFISFWLDFVFGVSICFVVLLLDVVTILKLHYADKKLFNGQNKTIERAEQMRRTARDLKFFLLACLTAFVFTSMLFSFHVLSRYAVSKFPAFFTTTFAWLAAHAADGVILFAFNKEYRRVLKRPALLCSKDINNTSTRVVTALVQPAVTVTVSSAHVSRVQGKSTTTKVA